MGVFYIPPELAWNQQQVAHARTSLTHSRGFPWFHGSFPPLFFESLLIATLKAWYKYRAMTKQQASVTAKLPPLQLPWLPPPQQQQGSPSCRPSIGPWGAERGSFAPCEIVHGQLSQKKPVSFSIIHGRRVQKRTVRVDGARHAVGDFEIQFWYNVVCHRESEIIHIRHPLIHTDVNTGLADITNGSALHHVPHGEPLDGLIFGHTARAVRATDWVDMATPLLVATVISSFFRLRDKSLVIGR